MRKKLLLSGRKAMDLTIVIATQKNTEFPTEDIYLPVQAGAAGRESIGCARDDTGDNISEKNSRYSELTVLYWAVKNLNSEYIGLVHYRRYFGDVKTSFSGAAAWNHIARRADFERLLSDADIILPKKRHYFIETVYSHYAHTHDAPHLKRIRRIISKSCPEYLESFDKIMNGKSAHICNMAVARRELLDEYLNWLLPLLEELERMTDDSLYTPFNLRYIGRISEMLLNVWVDFNDLATAELPMAVTYKINWKAKGMAFLRAKFYGEKYERSN